MVIGLPFSVGMHWTVVSGTNAEKSGLKRSQKLKIFYLWNKGLTEISKMKFQTLSG